MVRIPPLERQLPMTHSFSSLSPWGSGRVFQHHFDLVLEPLGPRGGLRGKAYSQDPMTGRETRDTVGGSELMQALPSPLLSSLRRHDWFLLPFGNTNSRSNNVSFCFLLQRFWEPCLPCLCITKSGTSLAAQKWKRVLKLQLLIFLKSVCGPRYYKMTGHSLRSKGRTLREPVPGTPKQESPGGLWRN